MDDHRRHDREERDAWATDRRVGDLTATFYPGEPLRCPGTKVHRSGARIVCGESLDGSPKGNSRVVVRIRNGRLPVLPHAGTDNRCPSCGSALEIFAILEAAG